MSYDADTQLEKVLRPPWRFEGDYHGQSGSVPILFTYPQAKTIPPVGQPDYETALDPEARRASPPEGISPLLAKFVPVPIGSTMLVLFPLVPKRVTLDETAQWVYVWRVIWRERSAADYTRRTHARAPFGIGKASLGAADSRVGMVPGRPSLLVSGSRTVIPASAEAVTYARPAPVFFSPSHTTRLRAPFYGGLFTDSVAIPTDSGVTTRSPRYPGATSTDAVQTMDYQQGVFDPNFPGITFPDNPADSFNCLTATFLPKFLKCLGNEFAVECYKYNLDDELTMGLHEPRDWSFIIDSEGNCVGGEDWAFSVMFGIGAMGAPSPKNPPIDTGVRVISGVMPA
jgi:hypothetical protein